MSAMHDPTGVGELTQAVTAMADQYLDAAIAKIDAALGEGAAAANPAIVAAYMSACGQSLQTLTTMAMDAQASMDMDNMLSGFEDED